MKNYPRWSWWITVVVCNLMRQGVSSFVLTARPIQRQSSIDGYTNAFSLMQQQLISIRRHSFRLSFSSTNSNKIPDTDPTKRSTTEQRRMGELTKSEQVAYDILCELSISKYSFRIVVVGKNGGAILESTVPCFGPQMKILQSPSTGTIIIDGFSLSKYLLNDPYGKIVISNACHDYPKYA